MEVKKSGAPPDFQGGGLREFCTRVLRTRAVSRGKLTMTMITKVIPTMMANTRGTTRRSAANAILLALLISILSSYSVSASAIAPPLAARLATGKRTKQTVGAAAPSSSVETQSAAVPIAQLESPVQDIVSDTNEATKAASSNPIIQLVTYVKDSMVNFKNGLGQMNLDHRRCNDIRTKQRTFAKENGFSRPRGVKGIQTGGITYEGETMTTICFMCHV